jgi:methionine-rich copper-binding protein CopC
MKRILFAAVMAMAPMAAWADHNHAQGQDQHADHDASAQMLAASTPSDGAVLAEAPRTLALAFAHPVTLQTVAITGPNGAPVSATFRRPNAATASYSIALPALASGAYEARWAASGGGHAMNGVIRFTVQ